MAYPGDPEVLKKIGNSFSISKRKDPDRTTMVDGDLTDAIRRTELVERMPLPEHWRNVDRGTESVREHLEEHGVRLGAAEKQPRTRRKPAGV